MEKIQISIRIWDEEDEGWVEKEVMYWSQGELNKVLKQLGDLGFEREDEDKED